MIRIDDNRDYTRILTDLKNRVTADVSDYILDGNILNIVCNNGIQITIDLGYPGNSYVDFDKCYDSLTGQISLTDAVSAMSDMKKFIDALTEIYEEITDILKEDIYDIEDEDIEEEYGYEEEE